MTDQRLDRIEAQQEKNTADIGDLISLSRGVIESVATLAKKTDSLIVKINESNQRFETLRTEAQADRNEYRALFNDTIAQMEKQQRGWQTRFDSQQAVIERLLLSLLDRADAQERLQARVTLLERPREAG